MKGRMQSLEDNRVFYNRLLFLNGSAVVMAK